FAPGRIRGRLPRSLSLRAARRHNARNSDSAITRLQPVEERDQHHGDRTFTDAGAEAEIWRVKDVRHGIAWQAIADVAFVAPAGIPEEVMREAEHVLVEVRNRDDRLDEAKVPAVALGVLFLEVEPVVADEGGLGVHDLRGKAAVLE